jgi:G patch domain-containing protein 1
LFLPKTLLEFAFSGQWVGEKDKELERDVNVPKRKVSLFFSIFFSSSFFLSFSSFLSFIAIEPPKRVMGPAWVPGNETSKGLGTTEDEGEEEESDEFSAGFLFAPKNVEVFSLFPFLHFSSRLILFSFLFQVIDFKPKNNLYGLGYDPFIAAPEFKERASNQGGTTTTTNKDVVRMSDIFKAPSSMKGFSLGAFEEAEEIDIYDTEDIGKYDTEIAAEEDSKFKMKTAAKESSEQIKFKKPVAMDTLKCSDNSMPLRGFRIPIKSEDDLFMKKFNGPVVPADWKPIHIFPVDKAILSTQTPLGHQPITAEHRGNLLGETPLPSTSQAPKSVFDLLSPEDRAKLSSIAGNSRFQSSGVELLQPEQKVGLYVPSQKLEFEKAKEKFEKTNEMFRPLGEMMQQRFVKSDSPLTFDGGRETKKKPAEDSYQETAASLSMFGRLTRRVEEWAPTPLLCKRFNVKNPYKGKAVPEKRKESSTGIASSFLSSMQLPGTQASASKEGEEASAAQQSKKTGGEEEEEEEENQQELNLPEKPSIDIFKAIFEDEEEEGEGEKQGSKEEDQKKQQKEEVREQQKVVQEVEEKKKQETVVEKKNEMEVEENPYLYFPPKKETRGGPAATFKSLTGFEGSDLPRSKEREAKKEPEKDIHKKRGLHGSEGREGKKKHRMSADDFM